MGAAMEVGRSPPRKVSSEPRSSGHTHNVSRHSRATQKRLHHFHRLNRGPLQLMRGLSGKIREHCIYFGLRRGIYRKERRTGRATKVAQTVERILQAGDAVLRPKHLGGRHKLLR